MKNFTHLIITRVNQRFSSVVDNPVWNAERLNLYNNCLRASLSQQTCQNFKLISFWSKIYPGGELENEYTEETDSSWDDFVKQIKIKYLKDSIKKIKNKNISSNSIINSLELRKDKKLLKERGYLIEGASPGWKGYATIAKKYSDTEYTLITRIDSDNCFHKNWVERIQAVIKPHENPYYYDIDRQFMVDYKNPKKTTLYLDHSLEFCETRKVKFCSGFVSVLEKNIKCWPYEMEHGYLAKYLKGEYVPSCDALITFHGKNIWFDKMKGKETHIDVSDFSPKL